MGLLKIVHSSFYKYDSSLRFDKFAPLGPMIVSTRVYLQKENLRLTMTAYSES
jgi:hypothetical protein